MREQLNKCNWRRLNNMKFLTVLQRELWEQVRNRKLLFAVFFIFILVVGITVNSEGNKISWLPLYTEQEIILNGDRKGKEKTVVCYEVNKEIGEIKLYFKDEPGSTYILNDQMEIIYEESFVPQEYIKKYIKKLKFNKYIVRLTPEKKEGVVQFFRDGEEINSSNFKYEHFPIVSNFTIVSIQFRNFARNKKEKVEISMIVPLKGAINMVATLKKSNDFTKISPEFPFPEQHKKYWQPLKKEVLIYEMEVKGIFSLVYPYKDYFAYNEEYPYDFLAYWRDEAKKQIFQYDKAAMDKVLGEER